MSNQVRTFIMGVVALVWAANFLAPIFIKGYKPPSEINVAFMGVISVLTAGYDKKPPTPKKPI